MRKWLVCGLVFVCALALVATEVFAVELSVRGRLRTKAALSNFPAGNNFGVVQTDLAIPEDDADTAFSARQRIRNWWIFKLNEHVEAQWGMEIGYIEWGENDAVEGGLVVGRVGRGSGGGFGADGVNVETKNLFMRFDVPFTNLKTTAGIFGVDNRLTNSAFFGTDMGGIRVEGPLGPAADVRFTWIRWDADSFAAERSRESKDVNQYMFDLGFQVPEGMIPFIPVLRAETGFYFFDDNSTRSSGYTTETYITGLNFFGQFGPLKLANWFAYGWAQSGAASQAGAVGALAGFPGVPAAEPIRREGIFNQFEANLALGPGEFTLAVFYTSGDEDRSPGDRSQRPTQDLNAWPGLQFMQAARPGANFDGTDNICFGGNPSLEIICGDEFDEWILIASPINDDLGIILPIFGYVIKPTKNTSIGIKAAPLWSAAESNPNSTSDSRYMGTEILVPLSVRIWDGLEISLRGAYFFTGDWFELDPTIPGPSQAARAARTDSEDVWLVMTRFQYNW